MEIVQATVKDLKKLVPLFEGYRKFYNQPSNIETCVRFLQKRLEKKDTIIFMAYENERAIGFVQLFPIWSSVNCMDDYILNDLFVVDTERGMGVGKKLLNAAKAYVRINGGKGLHLETAFDNPAQHLYHKEGWKKQNSGTLFYYWKVE